MTLILSLLLLLVQEECSQPIVPPLPTCTQLLCWDCLSHCIVDDLHGWSPMHRPDLCVVHFLTNLGNVLPVPFAVVGGAFNTSAGVQMNGEVEKVRNRESKREVML